MEEAKRAFGFVCPHCGKPVYAERTSFAMAAGRMDIICECGKSTLHMEPDALRSIICRYLVVCAAESMTPCAHDQALFSGRGIGLACAKAQQLCCYIGWPEEVHVKLDALAELCCRIAGKRTATGRTRDGSVL